MTSLEPICAACHGSGQRNSEFPTGACPTCHGTGRHRWVLCLIQARLGSTRFPGKVLSLIDGVPMVQHVANRARQIPGVDQVIIITPDGARWPGVRTAIWGWPEIDEDDVLARYARAATAIEPGSLIMRLTADCPALDPFVCGRVLYRLASSPTVDYASNDWRVSGYPSGLDCEVFTDDILFRADCLADDPDDREHVTPWMRRHGRTGIICNPDLWAGPAKLSVDTPDDLEIVKAWLAKDAVSVG